MKKILMMCLISVGLAGCGSGVSYDYTGSYKDVSIPAIGAINTAYVGENLVSQAYLVNNEVITFPHNTEVGSIGVYQVRAGDYTKVSDGKSYTYYSKYEASTNIPIERTMWNDPVEAIGVSKTKDNVCVVSIYGGTRCSSGLDYEVHNKQFLKGNAYQQELIYSGKVGNKININYRLRTSDGKSISTESNNVEYDLSESKTIRYKGAVLEIIKATNQYIEYKVISNFNTLN